jgi:hypothetical protein
MLPLVTGLIGGAIIVRLFLLFKRISSSATPEKVIMQIVVLLMVAASLPFLIAYFLGRS